MATLQKYFIAVGRMLLEYSQVLPLQCQRYEEIFQIIILPLIIILVYIMSGMLILEVGQRHQKLMLTI